MADNQPNPLSPNPLSNPRPNDDTLLGLETPTATATTTTTRTGPGTQQYFGVLGGQGLGFFLGLSGYAVAYGPGGAAGKSDFANGIDCCAVPQNPNSDVHTLILDNKASGTTDKISKCSAFTENPGPKIDSMRAKIVAGPEFPGKDVTVARLTAVVAAIKAGGGYVADVDFVLSNLGGFAQEATDGLQKAFFKATRLTKADGTPLRLGFMNSVPPSEMDSRRSQLEALASQYNPSGNPRADTESPSVTITKPVVASRGPTKNDRQLLESFPSLVQPAVESVTVTEPAISTGMVKAAGWFEVIKVTFNVISPFIWTAAERKLHNDVLPQVIEQLKANPGSGALLIGRYWVPIDGGPSGDAPPEFRDWQWQLGPDARESYGWWIGPGQYQDAKPSYLNRNLYFWFDGTNMVSVNPNATPEGKK